MVDLYFALDGICDAIAALENAAQISKSSRERRETADGCRARIIRTGSALAKADAEGKPLPWRFETIGNVN